MADVSATLGADNMPTGFTYRIASPSVTDQWTLRTFPFAKGGLMADRTTVDGALFPFYDLGSRSIENFAVDTGIPVGYWRSVGFSLNCFFVESFIRYSIAPNSLLLPVTLRRRAEPRSSLRGCNATTSPHRLLWLREALKRDVALH